MEERQNDVNEEAYLNEQVKESVIAGCLAHQNEQTDQFVAIDRKNIWNYMDTLGQ
jgi:hypothetical protein